jgi:archaellum component FlaD/FlaE
MGLRDVLADFLSSEGSQDNAGRDDASDGSADDDAQGSEDASSPPESSFDVELEELDQEKQVEALEGRLDDMEGSMQQNQSELETIRGSQQDVAEQLDEVNDTVRQLLGIYDQLTADVNPFMDGPTRDADPDADGFGVVGGEEPDPEGEVVEAVVEGDAADDEPATDDEDEMTAETMTAAQGDDAAGEDAATIGLEDLRAAHEDGEDARDDDASSPADGATAAQEAADGAVAAPADSVDAADAAVVSEDESDDNEIEVEPTGDGPMSQHDQFEDEYPDAGARQEDGDAQAMTGDATAGGSPAPPESSVALAELADTYASEIIVFEWLTGLVSTAGPAATLRAIAYYEEIGWIGSDVKRYLEGVLSGPDLDMNVDPSREPNELTAEDHAESYEYIMKLDAVQRTIDDTGL